MIKKILTYWNMTQLVKEYVSISGVEMFIKEYLDDSYDYNIFKTSKDEVLQIYNDEICYTVTGGSSGDKWEWRGNFTFGRFRNIFKKGERVLARGVMHHDYYKSSIEVYTHRQHVVRPKMIRVGHSRGGGIEECTSYEKGWTAIVFGAPKVFSKKVDADIHYVYNPLDPVTHVVPCFRRVGKRYKYRFSIHPHTQYGKHIGESDVIDG